MNWRIINALVSKDLALFFRNRFIAVVTVIGLIFYIIIYFIMPKTLDETLNIGIYSPILPPSFEQIEEEGLVLQAAESEDELKEAVIDGEYIAGIVLPSDIAESIMSGNKPEISIYLASDIPEEIKDSIDIIMREFAYQLTGQEIKVDINEEILGPDMMGMQIPPRNRMRPLLAVMLIIFETYGLASLIAEELERRTIQALMVTPMSIKEFFIGKGIVGISLAFGQAVLLMLIIGGLNQQPLIILTTLMLGAIMVTGIGFFIGSYSKDFMSVLAWGMVALIPLFIPSFGVMFPGAVTGWIKAIPSYYLVDTVHQAANFGAGWSDIWLNLLILIGFDIFIVFIGITVLRRKTR